LSILVIDDHEDWRATLVEHIRSLKLGEIVRSAGSLAGLERLISDQAPKVLILDAGLPDGDGMSWLARLRAMYPRLGIIMMTARVRTADKVSGLKMGADYYLTKPLNFAEFEATLVTLMRRLETETESPRRAASNGWCLDAAQRTLLAPGGTAITLSDAECAVVAALVHAAPLPVSRNQLIQAQGESPDAYDPHRLDVLMHRLRRKIAVVQPDELIKTVYGQGYACMARVTAVD